MDVIRVNVDASGGEFPDLAVDDLVIAKIFNEDSYITARGEVVGVEDNYVDILPVNTFPISVKLDWVRIGNKTRPERRSYITLRGEGENAPSIQLRSGIKSWREFGDIDSLMLAIGRLDGYVLPPFGALSGDGIYARNCHLTGDFTLNNGKSVAQIAEGDITLSAERTTVKDAAGNNIAIFKGTEGGVVEMQNIRVFGSVATPFKSVTPAVSGSYVLNMNDTYNFTLEATNSTIRTLRLPRGERYNGVTVSIFTNWNAPGIILITSEAPIMGFVSAVMRLGDSLSESSVGTLRGYQINMHSGRYIELKCVGTGNGNTGWVMTTYTDINL